MQLKCIHCPYIASSLIIGNDDAALSETSNLFAKHIATDHIDKQKELVRDHMQCMQIAMWIMMIGKHTTYLEDMEKNNLDTLSIPSSDPLEEAFDKQVEMMEELVGIEMFGNRPSEITDEDIEGMEESESLMGPPPGALPQ